MKPSAESILALLRSHPEGVTQLMALQEAGCLRLAARIADLRAEGLSIDAELVVVRTRSGVARVARYTLVETGQLALAL